MRIHWWGFRHQLRNYQIDDMASAPAQTGTASPTAWIQGLLKEKPDQMVTDWMLQFRSLNTDSERSCSPSKSCGNLLRIESEFGTKLWCLDDPRAKWRFIVGRVPQCTEMNDFFTMFTKVGASAVVNLSRLHEGPIGPKGAEDFTQGMYFPGTPGEMSHYAVRVGDTVADVLVTNARVTVINETVVVNELDVDVNVDISKPIVACHTIDAHQCCLVNHIQHYNWPPGGLPWCTDSVLETYNRLQRCRTSMSRQDVVFTLVILCSDGIERSGVFVALCDAISRSQLDERLDAKEAIFHAVKSVRYQCPNSIRNEQMFLWLHYALIEYRIKNWINTADKKEAKKVFDWLLKLRKSVYQEKH